MAPAIFKSKLNDSELKDRIESLIDPGKATADRFAEERSNLKNCAFYFGKQHLSMVGSTLLEPARSGPHRVFYTANYTIGGVNRAIGKLLNVDLGIRCPPMGVSRKQMRQAEVSQRIFQHHIQRVVKWRAKWRRALLWAATTGTCWMKVTWNPQAGEPERWYFDQDGIPDLPVDDIDRKMREDAGKYEDVPRGELHMAPVDPFQGFCDDDARGDMDECDWFAQVSFLSRRKVAARFGKKYAQAGMGGNDWQAYYMQQALAFMQSGVRGADGVGTRGAQPEEQQPIRVVEFWERPSSLHKRGIFAQIIGDQLKSNEENPHAKYKDASMHVPFNLVKFWDAPGRLKGVSLVQQMASPQYQLNRSREAVIEFQNIHGHPPIYVDKESGVPAGSVTNISGQVIEIAKNARMPTSGPTPALPKEIVENYQACRSDLQAISADASPDVSKMPGQLRSGLALKYMLEEKNMVLTTSSQLFIEAVEAVGNHLIALASRNYTGQRVMRYIGEDGSIAAEQFTDSDLTDNIMVTSVPDGTFSVNAQKAAVLDMVETGALMPQTNPEDRTIFLRAMQLGTVDEALKRKMRGTTHQEREIDRMIEQPEFYLAMGGYPAMKWEPHTEHRSVLRDFFQTEEFEALDPNVQALLHAHDEQHEQFEQQALQAQLMMMEMSKGTPGQPGKASQPRR